MPWTALEDVLRVTASTTRACVDEGRQAVPVSTYIRHTGGAQAAPASRVSCPPTSQDHLREGATLVLDAVDELQEPIERMAEALEYELRERVQVNLYAAGAPRPA
jgi:hypothetical protein